MDFAIALYDALVAVDVPADKARRVVDSLERDMEAVLATKQDLAYSELGLRGEIERVEQTLRGEIERQALRTTVVLGSIVVATAGLTLAAAALIFR